MRVANPRALSALSGILIFTICIIHLQSTATAVSDGILGSVLLAHNVFLAMNNNNHRH
jgi:hypothetical protein